VTRNGAVGLQCVPLGARRCATATREAGSIEAWEALLVRWEALVVRWEVLGAIREAPARPREATGAIREDVAASSDALFALRDELALPRSPATGGRASRPVTAPRPVRARSVLSSSRGAPSAQWAGPAATSAALVIRREARSAPRAALVVRGDAPAVPGASLVTRREARALSREAPAMFPAGARPLRNLVAGVPHERAQFIDYGAGPVASVHDARAVGGMFELRHQPRLFGRWRQHPGRDDRWERRRPPGQLGA
jgi:hypothetical protein